MPGSKTAAPPSRIPFVNIAGQHASIRAELLQAIEEVLDTGKFILGPQVERFEAEFAALCDVPYAIGVNSGTDALVLALRALDVGAGDDVITVPNSFVATASCIRLVGARPVFVDVGDDYNLDVDLVERAITERTRAILPVHLTGRPAQMDPVLALAQRYGLVVVEDCAQAVLAEYNGRRVGSFGDVGCFSLHPLKTLNACGDGGVLVTRSEQVYRSGLVLRNIGLRTRDECTAWSGNSRLDTIQAALLLVKLRYVERWTEQRRANARFYETELGNLPQVQVPRERPYERSVYHTFVVQAERRDELRRHLAERGIETAIHYPVPIHLQPAAAELGYSRGSFPQAERQAARILSLPVYPELEPEQLREIVDAIREFYGD